MSELLAGKVAIVTGGAHGIGSATVERFVEEGARVVIADLDADAGESLAESLGDAAAFWRADVSVADDVQALVDFTVAHFGGLHVMFNNAGVASTMTRFLHDELADFDKVMGVNVLGVLLGEPAGGPPHEGPRGRVDRQLRIDRRHQRRHGAGHLPGLQGGGDPSQPFDRRRPGPVSDPRERNRARADPDGHDRATTWTRSPA